MEQDRPGYYHTWVRRARSIRVGEVVALACVVAAIPYGLLAVFVEGDPATLVATRAISATCGAFALCYYVVDWHSRIQLRRMRRFALPPSDAPVWRPPSRLRTDSVWKPPQIYFPRPVVTRRELAVPNSQVCVHSNVPGQTPLNIAYFRCFANVARTRTFMEGAWKEFGYVHLLRDPASTSWRERWRSRDPEKMAELVVRTEGQLTDLLQRAPAEPVWHSEAPYGEYPVREFVCGDAFWQQAAERLIVLADLVVIDLSGLTPDSAGLQFELERSFATKKPKRIVLLADERSDQKYLAGLIRRTWPGGSAVINVYVVDELVSELEAIPGSFGDGEPSFGWNVRLRSDRAESRALLRSILKRL